MARFDSGIFGFLRGKIGTVVARMRYGKVYMAVKPSSYNMKSEAARLNRKLFSRRQRFNHEIRKHPKIKAFWKVVESDGLNDNTKLMIRNKDFVTYEKLIPGFGITPVSDSKILLKNINAGEVFLTFDFKLDRSNPNVLNPPYDIFSVLISDRNFNNTVDGLIRNKRIYADTNFITIEKETDDVFQHVSFMQDTTIRQIKYVSERLYLLVAVVKFNDMKNKYEWTDTYFEELFDFIPDDKKKKWDTKIYKFFD